MSSKYKATTKTTANYNSSNDNRLDELLEDLQNTVANKPQMNGINGTVSPGGVSTGYKEIMKSSRKETSGKPTESYKEYRIEHLNPSNSTTILQERSSSPSLFNNDSYTSSLKKDTTTGNKSYKTVSYEYNTEKRSTTSKAVPFYEPDFGRSEIKFRQNVSDLDTLLDDLNESQRNFFSSNDQSRELRTLDNTFPEPIRSSTPQTSSRTERMEERRYEEQRYGSVNPSPYKTSEIKKEVVYDAEPLNKKFPELSISDNKDVKKDLIFTGSSSTSSSRFREPSPARQVHQEVYKYESSTRKKEVVPTITSSSQKIYENDVIDNAVPFGTTERQRTYSYDRSGSPSRLTNYNSSTYIRESNVRRSPSPSPARTYYTPPSPTPVSKTMYMKTQENRRETTRTATSPPYRSPSPVSFAPPPESPELAVNTYDFERRVQSHSSTPQPFNKFSPSDPSRDMIQAERTMMSKNYKYSSHQQTTDKSYENGYRPEQIIPIQRAGPSPSLVRSTLEQTTPKRLDDLMASFSDTEIRRETSTTRYGSRSPALERSHLGKGTKSTPPATPIETTLKPIPIEELPQKEIQVEKTEKTNGVAGPPVYYPPGPLFTKKEESGMMMEKSANGKMKASRQAKYKYESGSKMKQSSGTKKTVVPLCLPMCCALPCVIM